MRETETETEKETERDRETGRQTETETERDRDRVTYVKWLDYSTCEFLKNFLDEVIHVIYGWFIYTETATWQCECLVNRSIIQS